GVLSALKPKKHTLSLLKKTNKKNIGILIFINSNTQTPTKNNIPRTPPYHSISKNHKRYLRKTPITLKITAKTTTRS
ncbi:hypothetical protein ACQWHS_24840, partial [Salmonella enterica subsp. enterica serovar Infantis]